MTDYTKAKGKWEQRGDLIVAFGKDGAVICKMAEPHPTSWLVVFQPLELGSKGWDVQASNANLIAAAPDMYEALKGLLQNYSTDPLNGDFFQACLKARQALAKADGKKEE